MEIEEVKSTAKLSNGSLPGMSMENKKASQGIQFLEDQGLNLYAVLDCAGLPDPAVALMQEDQIPLSDYARLVLLGNAGPRVWKRLQASGMKGRHPVDQYSRQIAKIFWEQYLDSPEVVVLYPHGFQGRL